MTSANDIISSIFRKNERESISPEFIRDESNRICDVLKISRIGDPGRTARTFAEKRFISKNNGICKYDSSVLTEDLRKEFESYQYIYDEKFIEAENNYEEENFKNLFNEIEKDFAKHPEHKNSLKELLNINMSSLIFSPTPDLFASDSTHKPSQLIYYGVPGCGKSNKIYEALKDVPDFNKIRTVFHPEYTNADFIGQILPKSDGEKISYQFTPGPFTEILARAYQKPEEHFYLVIEEINRGNAAAIFGDVFQLLDRDDSGKSQYPVHNKDLCEHLQEDEIRLPSNLSIIATMNTSDQNVFTLDNAFQRRFDMVLVRSGVTRKNTANVPRLNPDDYDFESSDTKIQNQFNATIEGTDTKWGLFWDWINFQITEKLQGISSTEDKRLGLWFVKNVDEKIPRKVFAEKVLKYLWDDVFKFKRREIFTDNIHSLEELISVFECPKEDALSRVFKNYPASSQRTPKET